MDWPGLWKFLSEAFPYILYVLCFLLVVRGRELLDCLRDLYCARQERLIAEANAQVRIAELELERERERNRPKSNYSAHDPSPDQPYQSYQDGLQELPLQY